MTKRKLLRKPNQTQSHLDRQRLLLLRVENTRMSCPACKTPVSALDAAGIDADGYDFGQTHHRYQCPICGARLVQIVPPISSGYPFWHWQLEDSWVEEQLRKARAFDQQVGSKPSSTPPLNVVLN